MKDVDSQERVGSSGSSSSSSSNNTNCNISANNSSSTSSSDVQQENLKEEAVEATVLSELISGTSGLVELPTCTVCLRRLQVNDGKNGNDISFPCLVLSYSLTMCLIVS